MWSSCRWLTPAICLGLASCTPAGPSNVSVDRRDLSIELRADGSARVRDTVSVRIEGEPIGTFERSIPAVRIDGFSDVVAELDGAAMPATGERSAAIETAERLDVRWRFPPMTGRHDFVVRYRANGVLFRSGHRGALAWALAPIVPAIGVAATSVRVTLPEGASLYEAPRIDGQGWAPVAAPGAFAFERTPLAADEAATLVTEISVDSLSVPEPRWQRRADRSSELMPAWVSSAIFVLVSGWGALFMLRLHYRSTPIGDAEAIAAEQTYVTRGLRAAGLSVAVFGLLCALAVPWLLASFGRWPYALPASIVFVGLWLIAAGKRFTIAPPPPGSTPAGRGGQ